ncbi:MAG: GNAT family N-acetyltransferase [Acidiphilium sp.]
MSDEIVPAGAAHAEALALVHAAAFGAEAWSAVSIATMFANPANFGFLSEAGVMVIARAAADEAEIVTIGVDPARRRAGLGRALLAAALAEAERRGAVAVFLEVEASNLQAIGLYRACGFVQVGRRRDYYGAGRDALLFSRRLCGSPG